MVFMKKHIQIHTENNINNKHTREKPYNCTKYEANFVDYTKGFLFMFSNTMFFMSRVCIYMQEKGSNGESYASSYRGT